MKLDDRGFVLQIYNKFSIDNYKLKNGNIDDRRPSLQTVRTDSVNIAFHLAGLAGPTSKFLYGTYKFSELRLASMALLILNSHSVQARSGRPKRGKLWRENVRARLGPFI